MSLMSLRFALVPFHVAFAFLLDRERERESERAWSSAICAKIYISDEGGGECRLVVKSLSHYSGFYTGERKTCFNI